MKKEHTYNITLLYKQVIVFDNKGASVDDSVVTDVEDANGNESGASFLVRILQYLETPQYLRRSLFPKHNSLRFVVRNRCLQTYHFDCQNYFCCVSIISLTQNIFLFKICRVCCLLLMHLTTCASMNGHHIAKVNFLWMAPIGT